MSLYRQNPYSQSYGFSSSHVQMWELDHKEGRVLKNWCFWTVVLERLLRVSWTARRLNQSILKEINPEYSLEGLMLKLKFQHFGHLMWIADSLKMTLMLGKIEGSWRSFFVILHSFSHVWLLWPHRLQHSRLLCPSPSPGACSNSCPLSQ